MTGEAFDVVVVGGGLAGSRCGVGVGSGRSRGVGAGTRGAVPRPGPRRVAGAVGHPRARGARSARRRRLGAARRPDHPPRRLRRVDLAGRCRAAGARHRRDDPGGGCLAIGHPQFQEALLANAEREQATIRRGVSDVVVDAGLVAVGHLPTCRRGAHGDVPPGRRRRRPRVRHPPLARHRAQLDTGAGDHGRDARRRHPRLAGADSRRSASRATSTSSCSRRPTAGPACTAPGTPAIRTASPAPVASSGSSSRSGCRASRFRGVRRRHAGRAAGRLSDDRHVDRRRRRRRCRAHR